MTQTCETCRYWGSHGGKVGWCRNVPPEELREPPLTFEILFCDDTCDEHQPKEKRDVEAV